MTRLASEVEAATVSAGFAADTRPFQAHMTLSRLPEPADVRASVEGIPTLDIAFLVDRVVLYESHLTNGPPQYEPLHTFELGL
jgi:2'-5' RNA ligase